MVNKFELTDEQKQTELVDLIELEKKYKESMKLNEEMWSDQDLNHEVGYKPEGYKSFIQELYDKHKSDK
ncbi:hypothetical protein UFOVP9_43 [uncultured Caudovirales phage]|jgi:hypothetical protein|uniref:Uncharacterized protein n=1 Tax=uncultured Caudovirales phage TaxID=2100421 RepID=A0A6J5KM18_9CAUD|nr:hypothetical protein UFOVP9_43 [uncultured Caudovirales phage]